MCTEESPTVLEIAQDMVAKWYWENEQREQEEQEKRLAILRQTVVEIASQRFPTLQRLARMQARRVELPELLHQTMLSLALASEVDEAEDVL